MNAPEPCALALLAMAICAGGWAVAYHTKTPWVEKVAVVIGIGYGLIAALIAWAGVTL